MEIYSGMPWKPLLRQVRPTTAPKQQPGSHTVAVHVQFHHQAAERSAAGCLLFGKYVLAKSEDFFSKPQTQTDSDQPVSLLSVHMPRTH
jgi:hypothetical protein